MSREEARRRTDEFKAHTEVWLEELKALYVDQVWYALDYETWDEYCQAEFGSIRLPRGPGRTEAVLTLRDAGLSVRAISSAIGVGYGTVRREIVAGEPNGSPDPPHGPPKVTIGQDGKKYPASSPTPPESSDSEPITITIAEPVEPQVVAPPRTPKRRSIVDTAVDLGHDLRKVSDRVVKITADDRLDKNRDGVSGQLRHYLGQMIESCRELGHRIDPPTEPTPAPQPTPQPEPTPAQARSQLDAAIADLAEQIRVELWRVAAAAWRSHHDNPATPPSHDEDKLTVAMAYVWQQGIDAGDAQPVTDCPAGEQFPVPDAPWPGLGLDDDSQCWGVLWSRLDDNIEGLVGKALRLERERVRYDVYGKVAKALNERIDELFDADGDWRPDDAKVKLRRITGIVAHQPTFFVELVCKVDRNAPPDFCDWRSHDRTIGCS